LAGGEPLKDEAADAGESGVRLVEAAKNAGAPAFVT